ncbi:hypothetical protein [Baekduia sp. Peel2402]|uniref:hypothetical protein n=1 Tax=Baekduia sp. Peel2402 TaxID=3458296 RepID=UPI00403EBCAB
MRRRAVVPLALLAALSGAAATVAVAATPKPVTQVDPKGDVNGALDLRQVVLARGTDGRLRASLTLAAAWDADDLLSETGPPGSLCLKVWTASTPPDETPDYLICATANADGDLRGSVLKQRPNQLPERTGAATITKPTERTITIRFSQTAIAKPATVQIQAETTRAGCPRGSCIDLAPDAAKYMTLKLRESDAK